ncbi:MAG: proline--tRNA ligase [Chloroflexota bacterium]|nr:MAG: proline--tRNA ligase [Chloroflexota bacterium]
MRMSQLFSQTLREAPGDAEIASHQLLLRAGFIRPLAAGIFSYLPLARRALTKIENIVREEMDAIGGQEITMPVVHPADIWKETGRWQAIGPEMGRFQDRAGRDMVLAMTHEEVVGDLVRKEIRSYRQLPALLYHIQTKWRDEPRSRAGLIRVREFTMKDSYSLDADWDGLDKQYRAHYTAYFRIYNRCGLDVIAVKSDTGMMGGRLAHEFMYLTPIGEDTLLVCDGCGYAANREVARFKKPELPHEVPLPLEKVPTPGTTTIESLAKFLELPAAKTAKAVFMMAAVSESGQDTEKFVLAIVRGDMEANETKLANAVKAKTMRPATEDEIRAAGAVPGYGSPVGVKNALVVVDDLIPMSPNLVGGANEEGYHFLNVTYGRDYSADVVADIAAAREGDACPECGQPLKTVRGVEVGNIFKLGTRYSDALGCTFLDKDGSARPVIMGSYGIGIGRLLACVAEAHHDNFGLCWPVSVAPYSVHLVLLHDASGENTAEETAETIYEALRRAGIDVLYDDRDERPGVKFNDADLIGCPLRLTVSRKSLEKGGVEMKRRAGGEIAIVPIDGLVYRVRAELALLWDALHAAVEDVPYKD